MADWRNSVITERGRNLDARCAPGASKWNLQSLNLDRVN